MKRGELPGSVLERRAIVYVRQSMLIQVEDNLESHRRQYELADHAREFGFRDIVVIDDDLGISASGTRARPGFESLVAQIWRRAVLGSILRGAMRPATVVDASQTLIQEIVVDVDEEAREIILVIHWRGGHTILNIA